MGIEVPHLSHLRLNSREYSNLVSIILDIDEKSGGIINLVKDGKVICSLSEHGLSNNKKYYYDIKTGEEIVDYNLFN